ncbi:MAG: ECF-type sigma factor [Planctomycetota bacterium]
MNASSDPETVTRLLCGIRSGEAGAAEALLPLVYDQLGALARQVFSDERRGHTLQPTALIHEAWVKLAGHLNALEDRRHFFALAARAMRQVLADHARGGARQKRGGDRRRITLDGEVGTARERGLDLVELDDSLRRLAVLNKRHARVVELRVLGGLTIAETADVLDVSHSTVETDWFTAKAWLRRELARA